jgi:hypothetical protein
LQSWKDGWGAKLLTRSHTLDFVALPRNLRIDMSAPAIAARLEEVRALYKLMVSLRQVQLQFARAAKST